jgi:hypothetical protein
VRHAFRLGEATFTLAHFMVVLLPGSDIPGDANYAGDLAVFTSVRAFRHLKPVRMPVDAQFFFESLSYSSARYASVTAHDLLSTRPIE